MSAVILPVSISMAIGGTNTGCICAGRQSDLEQILECHHQVCQSELIEFDGFCDAD